MDETVTRAGANPTPAVRFRDRHIGPSADEQAKMLAVVGYASRRDLVDEAVPAGIRSDHVLGLPAAVGRTTSSPSCARSPHTTGC
jgi:glycine dehydrogenase